MREAPYAGFGLPLDWTADGRPLEDVLATGTAPASATLDVRGNHGRWIVECPDCPGAGLACRTDPRFMCDGCGNASVGGRWRPVRWPAKAVELGELLLERTFVTDQNYDVGETVGEIREQNKILTEGTILDDAPAKASPWEKHVHRYPAKVDPAGEYDCKDCDHMAAVPGAMILAARAEVKA